MKEFSAAGVLVRFLGFVFLLCLLGLLPCEVRAQTAATIVSPLQDKAIPSQAGQASAPAPTVQLEQGIPLPQIADRAEELDNLLQDINGQLELNGELLEAQRKAETQEDEIRQRKRQTEALLAGTPTPMELEDEQRYWRSRSLELTAQRKLLTSLAAQLGSQIHILEGHLLEWQATWNQIYNLTGIGSVVDRVHEELEAIRVTQSRVQTQLNLVVTIQNQVSQQAQQITDALLKVRDIRERKSSRFLEADARPLWESRKLHQPHQASGPVFNRSFARALTMAKEFVKTQKLGSLFFIACYFSVLFGVFKLRRYAQEWTPREVDPGALQVLDRPFSVALLVALLATGGFLRSAPIGVAFLFYSLYLIPVLQLLAPAVEPRLRSLLKVLVVFYALEGLYQLVLLPTAIRRGAYALLVFGALVSFAWITRPYLTRLQLTHAGSLLILTVAIRAYLVLLASCLVTNIIGYVYLSQILGTASLLGPFVAAALYCGARVLTLILNTVLRAHWARDLSEIQVEALRRWGNRLTALGALLLWLRAMLHVLTIDEFLIDALAALFHRTFGFEKFNFTLGGVFTVVAIVLVGYCLAKILTFFLKKLILEKLPLRRGLPYAITTVTYYVCLLLVGLAALSASGVELNKFTVLTGGLGVGLGFGLQNIVNNFISGLILILERPIHVGDTVEVGGLTGTVRRIGARSSTVLTYQGAEVIVPNSNLLSNQVINWTLSSPWRRIDVKVGVAHGTDPEQVIKLLEGVAKSNPEVLLQRPPVAFFLGFGESVLNFELRFWSAHQDTWFQLQSDVTIAVAKALRQAGIEVPFPQRDLHIHSVEGAADDSPRKGLHFSARA